MGNVCMIDAREDRRLRNPFLKLVMIGKPAIIYPVQAAVGCGQFERIILLTNSEEIGSIVKRVWPEGVEIIYSERVPDSSVLLNSFGMPDSVCRISGRAVLITEQTLQRAYVQWQGDGVKLESVRVCYDTDFDAEAISFLRTDQELHAAVNAIMIYKPGRVGYSRQDFVLTDEEALVLNTRLDFELALYCIDRRGRGAFLRNSFDSIIARKKNVFTGVGEPKNNVCLIGHSQFDYWGIHELAGMPVRNCGIAGINSIMYKNLVLDTGLLSCDSKAFIVMHGVNDLGRSLDMVVNEILDNFRYIRNKNRTAPILFVACIHTNGRMDRTNQAIDAFNTRMFMELPTDVRYVDTSDMDDDFGNMDISCTRDGLHLNPEGYRRLSQILEEALNAVLPDRGKPEVPKPSWPDPEVPRPSWPEPEAPKPSWPESEASKPARSESEEPKPSKHETEVPETSKPEPDPPKPTWPGPDSAVLTHTVSSASILEKNARRSKVEKAYDIVSHPVRLAGGKRTDPHSPAGS